MCDGVAVLLCCYCRHVHSFYLYEPKGCSISTAAPSFTFDFDIGYFNVCRHLAIETTVRMIFWITITFGFDAYGFHFVVKISLTSLSWNGRASRISSGRIVFFSAAWALLLYSTTLFLHTPAADNLSSTRRSPGASSDDDADNGPLLLRFDLPLLAPYHRRPCSLSVVRVVASNE